MFRSTLNTDATLSLLPSMLKGNVCLSVTKFATSIEGNHHLEIYHATLYSLLFPLYLFSFYRATIKRRRMKSWPRAFLSETSSPPSSDRTRKSSSPSVPIFSFSFLFFFPCRPAVSVADFHGDGGYREEEGRGDIDPRSDFKFFHDERATTNELESCNEAWITRTSGPRSGARMHTRNAPLLRRRFPRPSRERT